MDETEYQHISISEAGARSIIQFRMSISSGDAATDEVQQEIIDFIGRNGCQKLIIDLSSTAYMPSSVIGILTVICSRGVEVHLANASTDVAQVMEVMGLTSLIHVNEFELDADSAGPDIRNPDSSAATSVAVVAGYIVACPTCAAELTIDKHSLGSNLECSGCLKPVHVDLSLLESASHAYCECPQCQHEMKVTPEWLDSTVKCESCGSLTSVRKIR